MSKKLGFVWYNRTCSVMISMLASSVLDYGYQSLLHLTKDSEISIFCCSAKYMALKRENND